eukprot:TRINITY_DN105189_c0_g1_i1.p1 TRINITY_DN105189_c0_g1~~TRINITY_DN105189_c0_g1_i1.p1  ORF type:complete len:287 (-),score=47.98 TRINITY_DN105189_c0_g1_i1:68-886(-)
MASKHMFSKMLVAIAFSAAHLVLLAAADGSSVFFRSSLNALAKNLTRPLDTSAENRTASSRVPPYGVAKNLTRPSDTSAENRTANSRDPSAADISPFGYSNISESILELSRGDSWGQGGDKMWGVGHGMEDVNANNVGYYNQGMAAAHAQCSDSGCVLVVNPAGHRTVELFHIHFFHYSSYGTDLKHMLENKVCGGGGWHGVGPCAGRAAYFPGFPAVFSKAMTGGRRRKSMHHASVIAWPSSCKGQGTIVELAFDCSIEHQLRGNFNPALR